MQSNSIESALRQAIASGRPGDRLPSVRELMRRHAVSPVSVSKVTARLLHEGLVEVRPGDGTYIARVPTRTAGDFAWQSLTLGSRPQPGDSLAALLAPPAPGVISLTSGYVDASLQPTDLLNRAVTRSIRKADAWGRVPPEGLPELRSWFAADSGADVDGDDVVIAPGGQAGLALAVRALTVPGDAVVVESPTYPGVLEVARAANVTLVPVPADNGGVDPALLADALGASGAKLAVLQPLFANPTGATLAADRRPALLDVLRAAHAFAIEDDYARDLAFPATVAPPPLVHDDPHGHIVHLRSLTKSTAPSLRVAGITARGPALRRLRNARLVDDLFVSGVLQFAAVDVVTSSAWTRHRATLRRTLGDRMATALAALDDLPVTVPIVPRGGLAVWVKLDDRIDDTAFTERARVAGVGVLAGSPWFAGEPPGSYIRISIGAADAATIIAGIDRLGDLLGSSSVVG